MNKLSKICKKSYHIKFIKPSNLTKNKNHKQLSFKIMINQKLPIVNQSTTGCQSIRIKHYSQTTKSFAQAIAIPIKIRQYSSNPVKDTESSNLVKDPESSNLVKDPELPFLGGSIKIYVNVCIYIYFHIFLIKNAYFVYKFIN